MFHISDWKKFAPLERLCGSRYSHPLMKGMQDGTPLHGPYLHIPYGGKFGNIQSITQTSTHSSSNPCSGNLSTDTTAKHKINYVYTSFHCMSETLKTLKKVKRTGVKDSFAGPRAESLVISSGTITFFYLSSCFWLMIRPPTEYRDLCAHISIDILYQ